MPLSLLRLLPAVFLALVLFDLAHHEPWRDELGAWFHAKASGSFAELRERTRFAGHPLLWHGLLVGVSRISSDPFAMQAANAMIATATVALIVHAAPFRPLDKALLAFGYFPFFEYATISRPYGLGLFLALAVCAVWRMTGGGIRRVAVLLALLPQTSAYGLFVAFALSAGLLVDWRGAGRRFSEPRFLAGAAIVMLGAVLAIAQAAPPERTGYAVGWRTAPSLQQVSATAAIVWRALAPIPAIRVDFWNTNLLDGWTPRGTQAVLGVALLAASAALFRRRRAALVVWVVGSATVLAFTYVKLYGSLRHHGTIFILFVASWWLALRERPVAARRGLREWFPTTLLAVSALAGVVANAADFVLPFSQSFAVARFVGAEGLAEMPIAGDLDHSTAQIGALLGKDVYFPASGRRSRFVIFDDRREKLSDDELLLRIRRFADEERREVLAILTRRLVAPDVLEPIRSFEPSIARLESFFLYRARPAGVRSP